VNVTEPAPAAACHHDFVTRVGEVRQKVAALVIPNNSAGRHIEIQVIG
jgi:hypothetical protein